MKNIYNFINGILFVCILLGLQNSCYAQKSNLSGPQKDDITIVNPTNIFSIQQMGLDKTNEEKENYEYNWANEGTEKSNPEPEMVKAGTTHACSANVSYVCPGGGVTITHTAEISSSDYIYYFNGSTWNYGPQGQQSVSYTVYPTTTTKYYTGMYFLNDTYEGYAEKTVYVETITTGSISTSATSVCPGAMVTATSTSNAGAAHGTAYTYWWFQNSAGVYTQIGNVNQQSCTVAAPTTPGTYRFMRRSYSSICAQCTPTCYDALTAYFTVKPLATVSAGAGGTICSGSSISLDGSVSYPAPPEGPTTMPSGYCASAASNQDETITKVTFNGASQSSGWAGYTDYTGSLFTTVTAGSTYNISVTFTNNSTYTEYLRVFFDWDRDGTFESSYLIGTGSTGGTTTWSANIPVPSNASPGATRMRVSLRYNGDVSNCESFSYGEVEDYKIQIAASGGLTMPSGYCSSAASNQDETITKVTFNGASQSSGWAGYTDYTGSLFTTVTAGSTYNISVTFTNNSTYTEYLRVFFDWDRDGTFESSYLIGSGSTGSATWNTNITVPLTNISVGETRMRVSLKYNGDVSNCESFSYGEVEDYKIKIEPIITYSWSPSTGLSANNIANPIATPITSTTYTLTGNATGFCPATSNVLVTVGEAIKPGTISAVQDICSGETPAQLIGVAPTGGLGAFTYQWQQDPNCTGTWSDISGATSANYQPGSLTANTCYRREVNNICETTYSTAQTPSFGLQLHYTFDDQQEPTVNYIPVNVAVFESFSGWSCNDEDPANVTRTLLSGQGYNGRNAVKIEKNASATSGYFQVQLGFPVAVTAGTTFTASIKYKREDAATNFNIGDWAGPDGNHPGWTTISDEEIDGGWRLRVARFTYTIASLGGFTFGVNSTSIGKWLIFSDFQLEMKDHNTQFVPGTRATVNVTDYSGNDNNGTIAAATTPSWTSDGIDGGAYDFDGVATKFIRSSSVTFSPTAWTISLWVMKRAHTVSSYPIFLSFSLPYIACSGSTSPFRLSYSATGQVNTSGTTVPLLNQWYHVVASSDANGTKLYVNGVLEGSNTLVCTNTGGVFDIGRHLNNDNYRINGKVDDVRIYNTTLTPTQIADLYNNSVGLKVTVNPLPAAVTVSGGGTQCGGSMTLSASGGSGGTIYWQGTTSGGTSTTTASSSQTVSTSGTYYFRSRSAAGCWGAQGSATVTINSVPTAVTVSGGGTQCGGSMTLNASGGSGGTIYWQGTTSGGTSTTTASSSQTVSTSGTYYFRSRSAAGCWGAQGSATVTINPVPAALVLSGSSICVSPGGNGTITSTTSVNGINYQLYNSVGTAVQASKSGSGSGLTWSGLAAGNGYYAVGTNASTSCVSANSNAVNIATYANPTATPSFATNPICSGSSTTLSANAVAGSGSITNYAWSSGIAGNNASGAVSASGTYTVTVTNSNSCTVSATSAALGLNLLPAITSATAAASPICANATTTLTANGVAGAGAIVTWWSGTGGTGTNYGTGNPKVLGPGTYYARVTGTCTPAVEASVSVGSTAIPAITSATAAASPICANATTTLTANGVAGAGATVTWYSGTGGTGTNFGTGTTLANAVPGTYYARVTGTCTPAVEASVTVGSTAIPAITSATAAANPICANATTTLTANGVAGAGATVTWWSGSNGTGTNYGTGTTLANAAPGTYYARVTGTCTPAVQTSVTVGSTAIPAITSATAAASPICANSTTTLTANGVAGAGAIVTWWSGTNGTGTNYGTGTTKVVGPGTYYARVTGTCTPAVEASVTVGSTAIPAITSATAAASPICANSTTTLTANGVAGGGATVTWWSGSNGTGTNYGTGTTLANAAPGTYYARVTGTCTPAVEASVTVGSTVIPAITSATAAANPICANATTTLTANGVAGAGATVTWYSGTGGTGTNFGTGTTLANAVPGTYYARVTGTCTPAVEASVTVGSTVIPAITSATAAANPICANATTTLTANGLAGAGATVTWWSGSNGTGTNYGTGTTLANAAPGTYYARVTGTCTPAVQTSVTVGSTAIPAITSATAAASPICANSTTTLTANGVAGAGTTVTWWSGTNGTGTNYGTGNPKVLGPGTYYARVTGTCTPAVEASVTVGSTAIPAITSATAATNPICANATTTLTANGVAGAGATVTWWSETGGSGTNFGTGTTLANAAPGTYYARVTGTCTPAVETSVTVGSTAIPIAIPNFSSNPSCLGSSTTLSANADAGSGSITNYAWSSGIAGNNASGIITEPGIYVVTVTNSNGCTVSAASPELTFNTPATTGVVNGDYVWSGNTNSDWETASNWLLYDGTNYAPALSIPDNTSNVFLRAYALCASNSAITTAASTVSCHNLTIETGLSLGNISQLNVTGNLDNSGTFTSGTGTVEFNGSSQQSIKSNGSFFYDVRFNNTQGSSSAIVLTDDLEITHSATFTNGIVNTNGNNLTFGNSATSNIGNTSSFVNGTVSKTGTSAFNFAIGEDSLWGPCAIAAPATASTITAQYKHSAGPANWNTGYMCSGSGLDHTSGVEHWLLTSTNSYPAVTLNWNRTDSDILDLTDLTVAHWNGNCWENMGGTASGANNVGSITSTVPFTSYSPITLGTKTKDNPLPIELAAFEAVCKADAKHIHWTTLTEVNNHYFTLKKSLNGIDFEFVAQIQGEGNSNQIIDYNYQDNDLSNDVIYYRLSQTDFDGTEKVFPMISVDCSQEQEISIVPNPFKSTITMSGLPSDCLIEIYGAKGEKIESIQHHDSNALEINLGHLNSGIYFVRILDANGVPKNFKIIKN